MYKHIFTFFASFWHVYFFSWMDLKIKDSSNDPSGFVDQRLPGHPLKQVRCPFVLDVRPTGVLQAGPLTGNSQIE